ncbi:uncharacterized protein LOC135706654 [Ochlerotatus camptorhynchus]|uniref:uncharacterized protein LOC135706654 n=1 Tax=Ochlerotatus camptorhynchus TaxID=644619 RepID=UPI0031D6B5ED
MSEENKATKVRKIRQYSKENLLKAVEAVGHGMSLIKAAKQFGVPRTTLTSYHEDRDRKGKMGPTLTFTDDEEQLMVNWTRDMRQKGMLCKSSELLEAARWMLDTYPRQGKHKDRTLSRSWCKGFYRRHPQVTSYLQDMREDQLEPTSQQQCYESVFQQLDCLELFKNGSRVFKYTEIRFGLGSNFYNYLASSSSSGNVSHKADLITTGFISSAKGRLAFPMIVYPHDGTIPLDLAATVPLFYGYGSSPNGISTNETFCNFVTKVFYKYLMLNKVPLPVILFVDGTKPNISLELWHACKALGISLVAQNPDESLNNKKHFLPNTVLTSHVMTKLREALMQWMEINGCRITESNYAELLQPVVHNSITDDLILADWKKFRFYQWIIRRTLRIEDIEFVSADPAAIEGDTTEADEEAAAIMAEPILGEVESADSS